MDTSALTGIVRAASTLSLDRVPAPVRAHAARTVADTIGVMWGGAGAAEAWRLVDGLARDGLLAETRGRTAAAASSILGRRRLFTDPARAAFLNATFAGFLELDEGIRPTGHPAIHVVPAAFAVAEREHASGAELLEACLAGYEAVARIFGLFRLAYPLHPHGHLGAIGGAVACALLDGSDPLAAAMVAATMPVLTVWDSCFDGATARNAWVGIAGEVAVRSTTMTRAGLTGSWSGIATGLGVVTGSAMENDGAHGADLDYANLAIAGNYFKRHSSCALTHSAIDALLQLVSQADEPVESVVVETVSNNMKLARDPSPNSLSSRFSLPYAMATVLVTGRTDPAAFDYDLRVAECAGRVSVRVAEDLESQWPDASPARVTIRRPDGRVEVAAVDNPRGHWTRPLSEDELRQKFLGLVGGEDGASALWDRLIDLESVPDCAELLSGRV